MTALAGQLYDLRPRLLRSGAENLAAPRQPLRPEVVTHVLGTFRYRCLRAGHQINGGGPSHLRTRLAAEFPARREIYREFAIFPGGFLKYTHKFRNAFSVLENFSLFGGAGNFRLRAGKPFGTGRECARKSSRGIKMR